SVVAASLCRGVSRGYGRNYSATQRRRYNSARIVVATCSAVAFSLVFASLAAAQGDVERISEREIARRQAALPRGEEALARGRVAMKEQNYTLAHEEFRTAVTFLPDASVSGKSRVDAVEGFCKSGVVLAKAKIAEGKYA